MGAYDESDGARVAPFEAVELPMARLFLPVDPSDELPTAGE